MYKNFLLLIVISLFLSCNKQDNQPNPQTDKQKSLQDFAQKPQQNSDVAMEEIEVNNVSHQKSKPIESKGLASYMPESVPGAKKFPPKIGTMDGKKNPVTTVTIEYSFANRGVAIFTVTDYGNLSNIPETDLSIFRSLPQGWKDIAEKVKLPDGKGIVQWNETTNSGNFYGLVEARYVVRIEGINLPKSSLSLQELYGRIKIREMIAHGGK
jgi:hypothetical protein